MRVGTCLHEEQCARSLILRVYGRGLYCTIIILKYFCCQVFTIGNQRLKDWFVLAFGKGVLTNEKVAGFDGVGRNLA